MVVPQRGMGSIDRTSLELLYEVSRELAAAIDLRAVLERVLSLSINYVGAANGSLIVLDENGQPTTSAIVVAGRTIVGTTGQLQVTFEKGLAGWVARQRQSALIANTSQDERWLRRPDDDEATTQRSKSALSVPLIAREQMVGVMTLVHLQPDSFTAEDLSLLQAIADQAAISVLNARLFDKTRRRAEVMRALAETAAAISGSLDLDVVLHRILEQISQALQVEVVSLALLEEGGKSLRFHATTNGAGGSILGTRLDLGEGIAGWVAREGQAIIVPDTSADPRFNNRFDQLTGFQTRAIACAPINLRGKVIGVLEAINPLEGTFESDALQVLTGIGSLAGTAIDNARLFEGLQIAHQRYQELFEDSIDPILITDWLGKVVEFNRQAAEMTGLPVESLAGISIALLYTIDQDRVGPDFSNLMSGDTISYESTLNTGEPVPVQVSVRRVEIDGTPHLQWILRDLSERKNLDNLRDDLISMIYHDLRSPLANIISSLEVIEAVLPNGDIQALPSLINIALRSTDRIQRLTDALLDISRLESGQPVVNLFPTAPLAIAKEAIDAVNPVAENKDQVLLVEIPDGLPKVLIDAEMIQRVLINLLENAVKYTPPGGEVRLGAEAGPDRITLWVQDTGPGIPPTEMERIFDKFTRLNRAGNPKGIGLGLAYCRLAVEGHGGRIWVENIPNLGARFCFSLPIVRP
jgi:PAS domain S-box-containing protein